MPQRHTQPECDLAHTVPGPGPGARDERGAAVTNEALETAMPGVYAAGAVRSGCGGMIEDAMAEGEAAARAAAARLKA